jgi:arylsulfatase A-like enzyme
VRNATIRTFLLTALVCHATLTSAADAEAKPNILFIFSDDHALRTIGAYGSGLNETPNIDRLAEEGALFTRSYCTNSICCPSRATILTGKHSHKNGVTKNGSPWNGKQFVFTRALSQGGYKTAVIGKWHLRGWPTDEFDYWKLLSGAGGQGHYYNPEFQLMDDGTERVEGYSTDIITDQSIGWMERQHKAGQPFMLMCNFKAPHIHRVPPPRHMNLYDDETLPEPPTLFDDYQNRSPYAVQCWMRLFGMEEHILNIVPLGGYDVNEREFQFLGRMTEPQRQAFHRAYDPDNEEYRRLQAEGKLEGRAMDRYKYQRFLKDYLRCVAAIDDNVGRMLAWLEEQGLAEDTVVVYGSDQGFFTGEHGWNDKRWMYEETVSMPLMIRWPGKIKPGIKVDAMVQNIDYAPTFLDMAGLTAPDEVQGRSLLPLFGGKTPANWRKSIYYHYYMDGAYNLPRFEGVHAGRYKLINYYFPKQEWELFDLEKDPQELRSVHADPAYAEIRDTLKRDLQRLRKQYDVTEPEAAPADGVSEEKTDINARDTSYQREAGLPDLAQPTTANASSPKPNFVLMFADDLGYGDVGYQGGDVPTPHIDSIASGGVAFTDGYVTCPVCAPSRAGLLTGRYQQSFGFWDNIGPFRRNPDVEPGIPVNVPILSERLKELGYVCGLFGKTHDGEAEEMMAFSRWDEFYGFNNGASNYLGDMNRPHNPIFHNRRIVSSAYTDRGIAHDQVNDGGILIRDTENYLTDLLADHAVRFIESNKDRPFLCYIPFNAIHGPFQAPKELVEKYSNEPDQERRRVMAILDSMDQNIGRVLETLRRNSLEENTLVVFLSDNGGHDCSPNRPLRGKKGTFWEGGLRVPFCMQWKGKIPAGQTYDRPIISLDLLPTFVTAAGGEVDPAWKLDGVDLMPFVSGQKTGQPHDCLYWAWGPRKAIRQGDMKAISTNDGKTWQLFDLSKDVAEQNDLATSRPKVIETLIQQHRTWEDGLMPQQWGWNSNLGYRDPAFGQPKPYHDPNYFSRSSKEQ